MAHDKLVETVAETAVDSECRELARQISMVVGPLQGSHRADHLLPPVESRTGGIGAELAPAGKPHDDHGRENGEEYLRHDLCQIVSRSVAAAVVFRAEHHPVDEMPGNGGEEVDERVDDALNEPQG